MGLDFIKNVNNKKNTIQMKRTSSLRYIRKTADSSATNTLTPIRRLFYQPQNKNIVETQKDTLPDKCCLCGNFKDNHNENNRHKFFKIKEEYRCKICNKFFYEHDHAKNPCFSPYAYII